MIKRLALTLVAACLLAIPALAQTANPQNSTNPAAPATTAKAQRHGRRGALRDNADPRVQELLARHRAERRACKANSSGAGCADMQKRFKAENRELRHQLKKEGKLPG